MVVVALRCGFCEQTFFGRNTSKLTQCSGAYERAHDHEQTCPERPASRAPIFVCNTCKPAKCFETKSKLSRHTSNTHGSKEKKCPTCKRMVKVGYRNEKWKQHIKRHEHPKPTRAVKARHTADQKRKVIQAAKRLEGAQRKDYLQRSSVSERQLQDWEKSLSSSVEPSARSSGAGVRSEDQRVVTPDMDRALRDLLRVTRGPAPEGHTLHEEYLEDNGHRTAVTYSDLADRLFTDPRFDSVFRQQEKDSNRGKDFKVTKDLVYKRVVKWCGDNDVVLRNATSIASKNEEETAARCLGTLNKIQQVKTEKGLANISFCNLDETALRVLALSMKTLNYKGSKCTLDAEQLSKFTLSLCCLWYSETGEVDFFVMCGGGTEEVEWTNHSGVCFATTNSKMMRKHSYKELLNFALSQRVFDVFLDDIAGGHGGTGPNNILKQLNPSAVRIRIQGGCTRYIQAADTTWCNQTLKRLLGDTMRKQRIQELMETNRLEYFLNNKLTEKGKIFIGKLLSNLRQTWNSSEKYTAGCKKAFQRLYQPTKESPQLSSVVKLLEKAGGVGKYEPYADKDTQKHGVCGHGCGHVFSSVKDKRKHEKDIHNCFPRRPSLLPPPFKGQTQPGVPLGMLFRTGGQLGVVVKSIFSIIYLSILGPKCCLKCESFSESLQLEISRIQ